MRISGLRCKTSISRWKSWNDGRQGPCVHLMLVEHLVDLRHRKQGKEFEVLPDVGIGCPQEELWRV